MLQIVSEGRPPIEITSKINDDLHTLIDKMTIIYGNPTVFLKMGNPKELDPNHVMWYCRWEFQNKLLTIGIARLADKNTYYEDNRVFVAAAEIIDKPLKTIADTQQYYLEF